MSNHIQNQTHDQASMLNRRSFIKAAGLFSIALALPAAPAYAAASTQKGSTAGVMLTGYLTLYPDGKIIFFSPTSEMGQGTHTAHVGLIADELGVPATQVQVEVPPPSAPFRRGQGANASMGSGGSWGVRAWATPLRTAAAQARTALIQAAAQAWGVSVETLDVVEGVILETGGQKRRMPIANVAAAADKLPLVSAPALRPLSKKMLPRVDIPAKVRGEAFYTNNMVLPGMVYGVPRLSPVFRASLDSFNKASALAVPGVLDVLPLPTGAMVIARDTWSAMRGAQALEIRWKSLPALEGMSSEKLSAMMREGLSAADSAVAKNEGDFAAAVQTGDRVFEADYEVPYLSHAPMEPWACVVRPNDDGSYDIWSPCQAQDRFRNAAAQVAGVAPEKIIIHTPWLGGGFGRRLSDDGVGDAVRAAMALKKPVKIQWTRETEQAQGWYRPALMARLKGVISNKTGCLIGLHIRTSGTSLRQEFAPGGLPANTTDNAAVQNLADIRYRVGAYRLDYAYRHIPVPTAPWRAVGATHNAFFLECFIDEVAAQVKRDPLELRREMLAHDDRALTLINTVAKAAGWGTPLAKGRARGLAYFESYGSLCAQVAEVSLVDNRPKVHKVWVALDCGQVVMPDGARSQVEGGVVQGLSSMMDEAVTLMDGQAQETNFDTYQLLRLPDAPEVETIFIENQETMGGVGEPPLPPVIPAVANALFALTGKPVRKLPIGTLAV